MLADTDVEHPPRTPSCCRLRGSRQIRSNQRSGFFEWCEANGHAVLTVMAAARYAVEMPRRAKAAIVAKDEYERDTRALLNLGHTFGPLSRRKPTLMIFCMVKALP